MLRVLRAYALAAFCLAPVTVQSAAEPDNEDLSNAASRSAQAVEQAKHLSQDVEFNTKIHRDGERALPAAGMASRHQPTGFDGAKLPKINDQALDKERGDIKVLLADPHLTTPLVTSPDNDNPHPLIFISFSMPEASLRSLLAESAKTGSPLVLRGLVENSMKHTVEHLRELMGADKGKGTTIESSPSLAIDPTLFERFGVDKVPAFVLPQDSISPCTQEGCPVPEYLKVAGDVSLAYALGVMAHDAGGTALGERAERWRQILESKP